MQSLFATIGRDAFLADLLLDGGHAIARLHSRHVADLEVPDLGVQPVEVQELVILSILTPLPYIFVFLFILPYDRHRLFLLGLLVDVFKHIANTISYF